MGTSLVNIDRTYGHLARDGHQHALDVLDAYTGAVDTGGRFVDAARVTRRGGQPAETTA